MRALKVTVFVVAIAAIAIVSGGWAVGRQAPVSPGEMYIGPETAKTLDFLEAKFGLSRSAAVDMLHRTAAQPGGGRVIDRLDLPKDAILDFIDVDGSKPGTPVRYLGSARALPADSLEGENFYRMYRAAALRNHWSTALAAMDNLRAHGTVLAPAAVGAPKPAASRVGTAGAAGVKPAASSTPTRIAVVCCQFPEWLDIPPSSNGVTQDYNAGVHYFPSNTKRNVQGSFVGSTDYYLDSPGGRLAATGGIPLGTQAQWSYTDAGGTGARDNPNVSVYDDHPGRLPLPKDGPTATKLQNYWFQRLFDVTFTGDFANDIGGYIGSLHNYYWDESMHNVDIEGNTTDIYGWVQSRHVLDRRTSAAGKPFYMIQPGTPVIRPSSEIISYIPNPTADNSILRASLSNGKLTILFKDDHAPGTLALGYFDAFQRNTDAAGKGIDGIVRVYIQGQVPGTSTAVSSSVIVDPYDFRRWTWARGAWKYVSTKVPPDSPPGTIDFTAVPGGAWSVLSPADGTYLWDNTNTMYRGEELGSAPLPNTLFTNSDTLNNGAVSQPSVPPGGIGNRLKSFDYYCHDYFNNQGRGPYQIRHIFHNCSDPNVGLVYDDIGGEVEAIKVGGEDERVARPYPFDCGLPSEIPNAGGADKANLGIFNNPNNANSSDAQHSSGQMESDANAAMVDQGISLAGGGTYSRTIFIFAGGGQGEGGGAGNGNWGSIISHAGDVYDVTVGEDCGLFTMAHELGHTFGFGDLYDLNFYTNNIGSSPPYPRVFECEGMNQYTVMAMGGTRIMSWQLIQQGWIDPTHLVNCQTDLPASVVPALEGQQRDPIVYKLPANPYYIADGTAPSSWGEYYLIEYRSQAKSPYQNSQVSQYWGDPVYPGVYIYHVDGNFPQRGSADHLFLVPEQADGLHQLETYLSSATGGALTGFFPSTPVAPGPAGWPAFLGGDPFGVDPGTANPNAAGNHDFSPWPFNLKQFYAGSFSPTYAPPSNSHGAFSAGHSVGGTDTDSFSRVLNIEVNGAQSTADIYVTPREIVATGVEEWQNWPGNPHPDVATTVDATVAPAVWQGQSNIPVMKLTLANQQHTAGDYSKMSMGEVTVRALRILQSGSSSLDADINLVKLWDIKDTSRPFNPTDPTQCTLVASTTLNGKVASFGTPDPTVHSDMNYSIALGATRTLMVTYDVSVAAQVKPQVTVGADLPEAKYLWPQPPGTVQIKTRGAAKFSFTTPRFPIQTQHVALVADGTDTLFVSSTSKAPSTVKPSDKGVLVLSQTLTVDHDQVTVHKLHYICAPASTPFNAQRDVSNAYLYQDANGNGAPEPSEKISEGIFSTTNELVFDNIDVVVKSGAPVPLLVTFDMAGDPSSVGDYLELQLTAAGDITLVDEDGPGNTIYQDPANPNHFADVAHGANPATWTLVAGLDKVAATGAPWKSIDFRIIPPTLPMLSKTPGQELFLPLYGDKSTTFNFRITYSSSNNVKPDFMRLVYRVPGAATDTVVDMAEVNAGDTNYVDGKDYIAPVTGLTAFGRYKFYFWAFDHLTNVYYYSQVPAGGGPGVENVYYTAPRDLGDYINGPIVESPSTTEFINFTYPGIRSYEEGRTTDPLKPGYQLIGVRVSDENANLDPTLVDHVSVTIKGTGTAADTETIILAETGVNTGVFQGSLPTFGKSGPAGDNVFNAIGGPTGQTITVTYKDALDTPPGANDTSTDTGMVVDTRAPDPIPAGTLEATVAPDGTSIVLDWAGYEATQIDVAGYKVYVTTSPFTDVSGLTPTATLAAGAHSYTAATTTEQTYYLAVCPYDEVPNMWKTTSPLPDATPGITVLTENTNHNAAPFIVPGTQSPAPGAADVVVSARTISVQVQDIGIGIDTTHPGDIAVTVTADDGGGVRGIAGTMTATPGPTAQDPVSISFVANADWHWGDTVTVHLVVKDKAGNKLDTNAPGPPWVFHVLTDVTPPTLDMASLNPTNGATGVARNVVVYFHLLDDASGVDLTSVVVQIQINGGGWTTVTTPALTMTPTDASQREVDCTYTRPGGFAYSDVVNFRVRATDRAGHPDADWLPSATGWGFSIYTTAAGLSIPSSSFVPANGATNVSRTPTIQFRVLDSVSTITPSSIGLSIDGGPVLHSPTLNITGTPDNYLVTYAPPTLGFYELHTLVATADDAAANHATSGPWSWRTLPDTTLPTFTLISPASTVNPLPTSTTVVVRVNDVDSLVDPATITATITGGATPVLSSLVPAHTIDVTFAPPPNLPGSSTINVHVVASDTAAPTPNTGTGDFSFTTLPAPTYTIVGRITNSVGGAAISAVQVDLTGDSTASTLTDGNGFYQFRNLLGGDYTVTPSSTAWSFDPTHRDITLTGNVNNADFAATQIAYALRGRITLNGNGLPGVNVSIGARSTTTLGDGTYALTGVVPGSYTVTPSLAGYTFTPPSLPAVVSTGDVPDLDFTAVALTFSIAGIVTDSSGNRLGGVSVVAGAGNDVTSDTGRYTIGGVPTGTVSVQVAKTGYLFFWLDTGGVYHMAPRVVSVPPDRTDINFVGYPVTSQSFSAGYHMIGVPIFPRDPSPVSVFGTDLLARWDPTTGVYATARAVPPNEVLTTNVAPGLGFWAYFTGPVNLQVAGTAVSTAAPYPLATLDGWNMLANPFLNQLPFANLVTVSGSIRPFAYTYDPVSGSYLLIAASPGIGIARSYILPWEAMWVLSTGSSSLAATAATTASAEDVKALQLDLGQNGWYLPVTARAGDRRDECCAVGVRASGAALSLEKPPAMSNSVDVSVLSAAGDRLARSIATAGKTKYQWDLLVTTDLADTDVSVALPDLSKVPTSMRVMLTDVDANKTVYMRTTAQYTFHTATTGVTLRHLQLTIESGSGAGLVISAASARASGSRVTVTYTASAPCSVTATVLNIAGRSVRTLASGAPAAAGVNTLSWDGRSTSGSLVPAGMYLVQLEAVADTGQRVRSVTQLNLSARR